MLKTDNDHIVITRDEAKRLFGPASLKRTRSPEEQGTLLGLAEFLSDATGCELYLRFAYGTWDKVADSKPYKVTKAAKNAAMDELLQSRTSLMSHPFSDRVWEPKSSGDS